MSKQIKHNQRESGRRLRGTRGKVDGGIKSIVELPQAKRSTQPLRTSEERFRLVAENVSDIITGLDADNFCMYASASYWQDGIEPQTIIGKNFLSYVHPDDTLAVAAAFKETRESNAHGELSFRFRRSNGDWRIKEATANHLFDNSVTEVLLVMRDVTDRVARETETMNLQIELERRNSELETVIEEMKQMQQGLIQSEKLASIGQLVAGIAHEINNPLAFVNSNLNRFDEYFHEFVTAVKEWRMLGETIRTVPKFRSMVESIQERERDSDMESLVEDFDVLMKHTRDGASRIKRIVEQLRGFTHLSEGNVAEADLNAALEDTLSIVWNEIKYKATVEKEYAEIPHVVCNIGEIKQVFVNLFVNAAQSINEKGKITVKTGTKDSSVFVEVEDTGSGIPPELVTKIFDPFFTTKPVGKGTGLGLWVSATIIEKHSGKINVESEVGRGTKMTVTFPIDGKL
ncbi:MAG: ATP-binding protein [Bacteroidetes bacterium]|nr:ATP-binding protein [Bacteroidota bacterium]